MTLPRHTEGQTAKSRAALVASTMTVVRALTGGKRTVAELADETGIQSRTVYRILRALPAAGWDVQVAEEPKRRGPGRPTRRYFLRKGVRR